MISVIVAVYDDPGSAGRLLRLLRRQATDQPFEVLICDDGSSVEMATVVAEESRTHPGDLRYVWQPHQGFRAGRSRNNGIRLARGDLLVFLDGDVLVEPDCLACHQAAHTRGNLLVAGRVKRVVTLPPPSTDDEHLLAYARTYAGPRMYPERQEVWAASPYPWMTCLFGNLSCPRSSAVVFDEQFVGWGGEDRELAYRLTARHSFDVVYEPAAVAYHPSLGTLGNSTTDPERVAQFLRNRLYLRSLYPGADLSPTLDLVRYCFVDPSTNTWRVAPTRPRDAEVVLQQAEEWFRGRNFLSYAR